MKNLFKLLFYFLFTFSTCVVFSQDNGIYCISSYGGVGDSKTNNTIAIQKAIDVCSKDGGGIVIVPSGTYLTGTLFLRNNVTLNLNPGSELKAIPELDAFPVSEPKTVSNFNIFFRRALIYAENVKNIGIIGQGTINGQGQADAFKQTTRKKPDRYQKRPSLIRFVNCSNILIENVKLFNSAFWTLHLMGSKNIVVHGISLISRTANYNNDGIDVDGCENARISDCYINSQDDAISIKSTGNNPSQRIMINNCILSSHCNAIRVGAENFAGFEDIHFSNCHIFNSRNGITFQNIDGFKMKRISFQGIIMEEVGIPIYVITGRETYPIGVPEDEYPCKPGKTAASIEDLKFDNIIGHNIGFYKGVGTGGDTLTCIYRDAIILSGHKDAPLIRCSMSNINFHLNGMGKLEDDKVLLPDVNNIPNPSFKSTPAYGIIARNTENFTLANIKLTYEEEDKRSAIIVENGKNTIIKNVTVQSAGLLPIIKWFGTNKPFVDNFYIIGENNIKPISDSVSGIKELSNSVFGD